MCAHKCTIVSIIMYNFNYVDSSSIETEFVQRITSMYATYFNSVSDINIIAY